MTKPTKVTSKSDNESLTHATLGLLWLFPFGDSRQFIELRKRDAPPYRPALPLATLAELVSTEMPYVELGRSSRCGVRFADHDQSTTSGRHARITLQGDTYVLSDLGSRYGSHVNGKLVSHRHSVQLGDVVRLGDWLALVVDASLYADFTSSVQELAPDIYGGPALLPALDLARRAAASASGFLIYGETGTGKERFARAVHVFSERKGEFLAFHAGQTLTSVGLSDLFGHDRSGLSSVPTNRAGYFAGADGGTLLLDDVDTLPGEMQPALLRVLQEKELVPLAAKSVKPIAIDVLVVATTNKVLEQEVRAGYFREDLYYRLKSVEIELPPLRKRRADIPELFRMFFERSSKVLAPRVNSEFVERLCLHDWPGNVRELEKVAETLALLAQDKVLGPDALSGLGAAPLAAQRAPSAAATPSRREARAAPGSAKRQVREHLQEILGDLTSGATADELERKYHLSKATLYRTLSDVLGEVEYRKLLTERSAARRGER